MDCRLIEFPNIFDLSKKQIHVLPFVPGTRLKDAAQAAGLGPDVLVTLNGEIQKNPNRWIMPGDVIHIFPQVHDDAIKTVATIGMVAFTAWAAPAVGAWMAGAMGFGSATLWGSAFTFVSLTAGGMLINSLMPPPAYRGENLGAIGAGLEGSPTYGWQITENTTDEGLAIPVCYGLSRSTPQIINRHLEIDSGGNQWAHILLSVAEGLTNNVPTADDVYVGDEVLSFFEESDYELYATDGGANPDTDQLVKFQKLHQFRPVQKRVVADHTANLLHFNGTDGSTTIVDESIFDGTWECQGTADLSTAHPWKGTANLDLTNAATDYVKYYQGMGYHNWNIYTVETWDIEFRFRQATLVDSGIVYQYADLKGYPTYGYDYEMFWSIRYDHTAGNLVFQQFKRDNGTGDYTVYFNVSGAVSLSVDTWHHIRVARSGNTAYLFLDGVLKGSGAYSTTPEVLGNTGSWYQGIGRAYEYDAGGPSHTLIYAQAEIDEFQFKVGSLIYDSLTGFTPADDEAAAPEYGVYTVTRGQVDEISFIVEATYGLYWVNAQNGNLEALTLYFDIMYRKVGDSSWTTESKTFGGNSRYPVRDQWTLTMPSRGQYEIRVVRKSPNYESPWQTRTYWTGLDEILDEFLTYPYLQTVSISLKAQDEMSGTVPVVRVVNNRDSIEVPNFSGSGTQIVSPTNNAYASYDMLTNDLYGGGVDPTRFDEDFWQDWIDWCNGSVDGNLRCQFNMIMDAQYSMDEALQHVENTGRAKIVMRGTQISAAVEKPETHSNLFCSGNVKVQSKISWLPQFERSDAVEISFRDKDNLWQTNKAVYRCSGYETLNRVPRIVRFSLPGINNYEQALREAVLRQQISDNIRRSITLESGIESIMSTVGDVVRFAHEGNAMVAGGRLAADSAGGSIRIDKKITLDSATFSGNCKIWIKTADDTILEGTVTGPFDEETDLLYTTISSAVERFDNYIVGRASGEKYLYRLVSAQRNSNQDIAFNGLQYNEDSYYHEDYGGGSVAI